MVSQADLDLIQNFAVELEPFIDSVLAGAREYKRSPRDPLVIGQAVQALGMIRGAGSILMVDPLVQIADMLSEAFDVFQANQRRATVDAVAHLHELTGSLLACLDAMTAGRATEQAVDDAKQHLANLMRAAVETDRLNPLTVAPFFDEPVHTPPAPAVEPIVRRDEPKDLPAEEVRIPPLSAFQNAEETSESGSRDVFLQEASGLAASFRNQAIALSRSPADRKLIVALCRDARTLKNAADAAGYSLIGQVGAAVERLLNRFVEYGRPVDHDALELALVCWKMLPAMLKKLDDLTLFTAPVASIVRRSEELAARFDDHPGGTTGRQPASGPQAMDVRPEPSLKEPSSRLKAVSVGEPPATPWNDRTQSDEHTRRKSHLHVVPDYLDQFGRPPPARGVDVGPPPDLGLRPDNLEQPSSASPAVLDRDRMHEELLPLVRELVAGQTQLEQRLARLAAEQDELVRMAALWRRSGQNLERRMSSNRAPAGLDFDGLTRDIAEIGAAIDASTNDLGRIRSALDAASARQRAMVSALQDALKGVPGTPD